MYSGNDGWKTTAPVGSVKGRQSPFGVMDMGGNVTEWLQDWYRNSYQKSDGPTKIVLCAGRRGSTAILRSRARPYRGGLSPVYRFGLVGFLAPGPNRSGHPNT